MLTQGVRAWVTCTAVEMSKNIEYLFIRPVRKYILNSTKLLCLQCNVLLLYF